MANPALEVGDMPPEYLAQIEDARRRQAIAQAMQQQFMQGQPTQFVPGGTGTPIAVKTGGLGALAQALSGTIAGAQNASAGSEIESVRMQNDAERQKEYQDFVSNPDKTSAISKAMASRRGGVRAFGLEQQKREQEIAEKLAAREQARILAAGGLLKDTDAQGGLGIIQSGVIPQGYTSPGVRAPEIVQEGKDRYALVYGPNGKVDLKWAPKETNVKMSSTFAPTLPGQKVGFEEWAKAAVKDNQEMGASARSAGALVTTLTQMGALDDAGIVSGPAANPIVFVAGLARQAGLPVDEAKLANTQVFNSLAQESVQQLIGQYGGNRGVTKEEAAQIAQSLPQIQQSPQARKVLSSVLVTIAKRRQAQYQTSREALNRALKTEDMTAYDFGDVQVPPMQTAPVIAPAGQPPGTAIKLPPGVREVPSGR